MSGQNKFEERFEDLLEIFHKIKDRSLLSFISGDFLHELLKNYTTLITCEQGFGINSDLPVDAIYIIGKGSVALYESPDSLVKIDELREGKSLELETLYRGLTRWKHRWVTQSHTELLRIEWMAFRTILHRLPLEEHYLQLIVTNPPIQRLKNEFALVGIKTRDLRETICLLQELPVPSAETLKAGSVYLVQGGEVTLKVINGKARVSVAHYLIGDYFFLDPHINNWRIESSPDCRVWALDVVQWSTVLARDRIEEFLSLCNFARVQYDAYLRSKEGSKIEAKSASEPDTKDDDPLDVPDFRLTVEQISKIHKRRPVCVRQHDEMDCGAACMATVAKFWKRRISTAHFRSLVNVTRDGTSLLSLQKAAKRVGMEAIGVMSSPKGLKDLQVPMIALMQYHFVVLFKITDNEVIVSDPGLGIVTYTMERFQKEYSKNVLLVRPSPEFYEYPQTKSSYWQYLGLFRGNVRDLFHVFAVSMLMFALGLVMPMVMQIAVDGIVMNQSKKLLPLFVLIMVASNLTATIISWIRNYLVTHLSSVLDAKLSTSFIRHLFSLPLGYFSVRRVGDFLVRVGELSKIQNFLTQQPLALFFNLLAVVIYSTVVFFYSAKIFFILLLSVPLMAAVIVAATPVLSRQLNVIFQAAAQNSSILFEQFQNIETVRALNSFIASRWRWESSLLSMVRPTLKYLKMSAYLGGFSIFFQHSLNTIILLVAVREFMHTNLTLGQVMAVTALAGQIIGPVTAIISQWKSFSEIGLSLARIDDVMTAKSENLVPRAGEKVHTFQGAIRFENVEFRYGSEMSPLVLKSLNFTINPGERIALVGRSGCGKSTLGYMINRLYPPTRGEIYIDNYASTEIPLWQLRKNISIIMQDCRLMTGTLFENIAIGDPHPSFKRVIAAAQAADAHEFIVELKEGYLTRVGEGGAKLSGGQAQRIGIARALYNDPKILIMDEATSALDALSERNIISFTKTARNRRTTLIIAHRLNTILFCDRILVMDQGMIVESGTHRELMAEQGLYYDLFRLQATS